MNNDEKNRGLKLLDDALFDPQKGKDAFGHKTYANLQPPTYAKATAGRRKTRKDTKMKNRNINPYREIPCIPWLERNPL